MAPPAPETEDFAQVTEGKATILFPKDHVFYNPVQQFNRDLTIAVIRAWSEAPQTKAQLRQAAYQERKTQTSTDHEATKEAIEPKIEGRRITILEALSASGLRAIRFALEIPNAKVVYANDMSADAVDAINRNIAHNKIPEGKMSVSCSDANALMYSHQTKRIDVIDLDPYGTAAPFIDAAIQALASDALVCVTCTDMSVLAGPAFPEKCYANYGGVPVKQEYTHEVALRLVLNSFAISAARYGRAIEPLLCLSIDFYVRLFVRVVQSPLQVKYLPSKTMITYNCEDCGSWSNQLLGRTTVKGQNTKFHSNFGPPTDGKCPHCGGRQAVAGPMWAGPLHNHDFVERLKNTVDGLDEATYITRPRMQGMLNLASEELDVPFYRTAQDLSRTMKITSPSLDVIWSALKTAGYNVSSTHCFAGAFKTDAPHSFLWDMMKAWAKGRPVKPEKLAAEPNAPFARIAAIPATTEVDLTVRKDVVPNRTKIARFVDVPPNWGPGALPGKKERVKRKREDGDDDAEDRNGAEANHAEEMDTS